MGFLLRMVGGGDFQIGSFFALRNLWMAPKR